MRYDIITPMLIATIFTNFVGILLFLFIFWKRLKDDYASEVVFKLGFNILIGIGIAVLLSFKFFKIYFFWAALIGGILLLILSLFKIKAKFYEIFEAFIIASLPWFSGIFLLDSVINSSLSSFLGFLFILFIIFISYYIDAHYKNFNWFKSGKIGFTGFATLFIIFLLRFALAIARINVLSFVGRFEAILSGLGMIACYVSLYNLGKLKE